MISLAIGPKHENDRIDGSEWDQIALSELVNRLGKKLELIGQMDQSLMATISSLTQGGGFIQWYDLIDTMWQSISSSERTWCTVVSFTILFKAADPGMDPITMNERNLYTFVRALGTDLEQLQGLSMSQMIRVSYCLRCAGFVESFVVQGSSHEIFQAESDRTSIADSFPSTLFSPQTMTPETVYTPRCEFDGASCYPTPSTISADTAQIMDQSTITTNGPSFASESVQMNGVDQTILRLLRSCRVPVKRARGAQCSSEELVGVDDHQILKILQVASFLIALNPDKMLRSLLNKCDTHTPLNLSTLGLPLQWRGIQAAVDFLRVLDSETKTSPLDPLTKRFAQVMLHFNYKELCEAPERYCSLLSGKSKKTSVLEAILDCYTDDPRISNTRQSRRNRITTYHVRQGKWWWRLAGNCGAGLLFTADPTLIETMCNHTFTDAQIDVLVTYILKTRPGSIQLFKELGPVVESLMVREVRYDLRQPLLNKKDGPFGEQNLAQVFEDDKYALASQRIELPWEIVDSKAAEEGLPKF